MLQRCKQIIVYLMLLIFTTYYVNITFFQHSHIINGVTIVHSHFHNKAHAQTGTHSTIELTMIAMLSAFHSLQASAGFVAIMLFTFLCGVILAAANYAVISLPAFHYSLRAPPCQL